MNKKITLLSLAFSAYCNASFSTDLAHVYHQALDHDQTFAQAHATWLSAKTSLLLAQSSILPTVSLVTTAYSHKTTRNYHTTPAKVSGWNWSYGININEPLFNAAGWVSIGAARDNIKAATATFFASAQTLISDTFSAYITVLKDYDNIRYNEASKRAFYRQMVTAEQQYKVGLKAKTSVYDAKANYDKQVASSIAARTTLRNDLEALTVITGYHHTSLNGIRYSIPLAKPSPASMQQWVRTALHQNYNYQASRYATLALKKNIQMQALTAAPVLALTASHSGANAAPVAPYDQHSITNAYGLGLSFTPFQGGNNIALTRKARFDYEKQSALELYTYRNVISSTRQAYLGVTLGISKIRADRQSIQSARKSLEATKQGYNVGTNTMTEVLDDITTYYEAQKNYMDDQYDYLQSLVSLKLAAGTLSSKDITYINTILNNPIDFTRYYHAQHKVNPAITPILKRAPKVRRNPSRSATQPKTKKRAALSKIIKLRASNVSATKLPQPQLLLPQPASSQVATIKT